MVRDRRRGAALFVVLLFTAFLSALAAAALRTGLSGARAAAVFADGLRADELGRGAADALAYRLATGDAAARRGGAIGLRLPGADVTIDFLSESARVDANLAPVALISALLAGAGADPSEAGAVAARITRFRAEAEARAKAGTSPVPGGGGPAPGGLAAIRAALDALGPAATPTAATPALALHDVSEVVAAWGLSDAVARRILPSLTVSNGAATVDPVLADRAIVLALAGGEERADDYLQRRRQGFADKDSALALLPVAARAFVAFKDSAAVRGVARVRVADRIERRYEMILAPPALGAPAPGQGAAALPVVVSWRKVP